MNGDKIYSDSSLNTAQLLCNGAIEARVLGYYFLISLKYAKNSLKLQLKNKIKGESA